VSFTAVKHTTKDGKVYLTLDITKDALEAAPGPEIRSVLDDLGAREDVNRARSRNPTVVGAIDLPHFSVGGSRAVLAKASVTRRPQQRHVPAGVGEW
jgi:hypothetical protein